MAQMKNINNVNIGDIRKNLENCEVGSRKACLFVLNELKEYSEDNSYLSDYPIKEVIEDLWQECKNGVNPLDFFEIDFNFFFETFEKEIWQYLEYCIKELDFNFQTYLNQDRWESMKEYLATLLFGGCVWDISRAIEDLEEVEKIKYTELA